MVKNKFSYVYSPLQLFPQTNKIILSSYKAFSLYFYVTFMHVESFTEKNFVTSNNIISGVIGHNSLKSMRA